jgi:hypothetical protein
MCHTTCGGQSIPGADPLACGILPALCQFGADTSAVKVQQAKFNYHDLFPKDWRSKLTTTNPLKVTLLPGHGKVGCIMIFPFHHL